VVKGKNPESQDLVVHILSTISAHYVPLTFDELFPAHLCRQREAAVEMDCGGPTLGAGRFD
jgi:hypothetical protein